MEKVLNILLIDDNAVDRMSISRRLRQSGYEYKLFETGSPVEGLEIARDQNIDCVFLDFHMPELDGPNWVTQARPSLAGNTKIIVMTNMPEEHVQAKFKGIKVDGVFQKSSLVKPTAMQEILQFLFGI